jgi:hypothetical protein
MQFAFIVEFQLLLHRCHFALIFWIDDMPRVCTHIAHVSLHCSWNHFHYLIRISSGLWSSWEYAISICCGVWATITWMSFCSHFWIHLFRYLIWISSGLWSSWEYAIRVHCGVQATITWMSFCSHFSNQPYTKAYALVMTWWIPAVALEASDTEVLALAVEASGPSVT